MEATNRKETTMKRLLIFCAIAALGAGFTLSSGAATAKSPKSTTIVIRHQTHGCHTWSVDGGAFGVSVAAHLRVGGSATITNNDIMPHKLIRTSGPAVTFVGQPAMNHMGASVKVVFPHAGTYRFTTKPGEDYMGMTMMKTIGPDNVLRLTVTVR